MPYAVQIANHEGDDPQEYIWEALRGEARIFVFWHDGQPTGACATRVLVKHDGTRTGEFHWIAGQGVLSTLTDWLPQLEAILARDHGVTRLRVTGRNGWARTLTSSGYRRVKIILEKGVGE